MHTQSQTHTQQKSMGVRGTSPWRLIVSSPDAEGEKIAFLIEFPPTCCSLIRRTMWFLLHTPGCPCTAHCVYVGQESKRQWRDKIRGDKIIHQIHKTLSNEPERRTLAVGKAEVGPCAASRRTVLVSTPHLDVQDQHSEKAKRPIKTESSLRSDVLFIYILCSYVKLGH